MKVKKIIKQNFFGFIIGALMFGIVGVYAATVIYSGSDIEFSNSGTDLNSTNVQDAINEINTKTQTLYDNGYRDGYKKGLEQASGIKIASSVSSFSQAYSIPGVTLTADNFSYRIVKTDKKPCTWTDSWGGQGTVAAPGAPGPSLTYSNGVLTLGNTTASHYDYNGNDGSGCTARTTVYVDIYCNITSDNVN